jgi:hypothetical protein
MEPFMELSRREGVMHAPGTEATALLHEAQLSDIAHSR